METSNETTSSTRPNEIKWIAILIGFTFMRAFMGIQLPTLEMYGGENPKCLVCTVDQRYDHRNHCALHDLPDPQKERCPRLGRFGGLQRHWGL